MRKPFSIFFSLFVGLIFLGGLFVYLHKKEITLKIIDWQLKKVCWDTLGATFSYDSLVWDQKTLVLTNGKLENQDSFKLSLPKVTFRPAFKLLSREIGGELHFEKPLVTHIKKHKELAFRSHEASSSWVKFNFHTQVERGTAILYDFSNKDFVFQKISFELDHLFKDEEHQGNIALSFSNKDPSLWISFSQNLVNLEFQKTALSSMLQMSSHLFASYLPAYFQQWHCTEGKGMGEMAIHFEEKQIKKISGKMAFDHIKGENKPLSLLFAADHIQADVDLELLSLKKFETWNGNFNLSNGFLHFSKNPMNMWSGMCDLYLPRSQILVKEGKVESSLIRATLMGMEGDLEIDWLSDDVLMKMNFSGATEKIAGFVPESLKPNFLEAFPDDDFHLKAKIVREKNKSVRLEGKLLIASSDQENILNFGCHFGETKSKIASKGVLLEPSFSQSVNDFVDHLKEQFFFSQKRVGWMNGKAFPLEKFFNPFILYDLPLQAQGNIDFEGIFDERFLILFYQGKNFALNGSNFSLHVDEIAKEVSPGVVAVHYFDFNSKQHQGFFPLVDASYRNESFNLNLPSGNTLVRIDNQTIRLEELHTQWEDLSLRGEIEIDVHHLDDIELKIASESITGKTTSALNFLNLFIPFSLHQLPIDGTIAIGKDDLKFHFAFHPFSELLDGHIRGHLLANCRIGAGAIEDYNTNFNYDYKENILRFSEGRGHLSLFDEEGLNCEIYTPSLTFSDFPKHQMQLEFFLHKNDRSLFHCRGKSEIKEDQRTYHFYGTDFLLKGYEETDTFVLEQGIWGRLKASGKCVKKEDSYQISNLHLVGEDLGECIFTGILESSKQNLTGKLNKIALNLERLGSTKLPLSLKKWIQEWNPKGEIIGSSDLIYDFEKGYWQAEATTTFKDLECAGIHFGDGENLRCHFSSDQGVIVEGLEVEVPSEALPIKYKLGKFHYKIDQQKLVFEAFDFSLPLDRLEWISDLSARFFPGKMSLMGIEWAQSLKQEESLEGRAFVEVFPHQMRVFLHLKDGNYYLGGKKCTLKNLSLAYTSDEIEVFTDYLFKDHFYHLHLTSKDASFAHGKISINEENSPETLTMRWYRDDKAFYISKMTGSLLGLKVALEGKDYLPNKHYFHLFGSVDVDAAQLQKLLPANIQENLEKIAFGKGYHLEGDFYIPLKDWKDLVFQGTLSGSDFDIGNLEFDSLCAEAYFGSEHLYLKNLAISDPAGKLVVPEAHLYKENQDWVFNIPSVEMRDFRLSKLQGENGFKVKKGKSLLRSLMVPSLKLVGIKGILGDSHSFTGGGSLHFSTVPKKTFLSNLLLIPTEITARIGLDLSLLVPVRGEISYEIKDGKIYLKKFKNMYSDGKRSRFYLADGHAAYVDFDGNLNLKVKMKQYNLLMKLAEFFTFTIKGTVFKPSYTFMNQFEDDLADDD